MFCRRFRTPPCLVVALLLTVSVISTLCAATHNTREEERSRGENVTKGRARGFFQQLLSKAKSYATFTKSGQNSSNHAAVEKLLGFERSLILSEKSGPFQPRQRKSKPAATLVPKYVLGLYEKYRQGQVMEQHVLGNTVRSIPAKIGEVNGKTMFIFNLSSITGTERLLRVHLHLYKRRQSMHRSQRSSGKGTDVALYEVTPHSLRRTAIISMRSLARGWQWYTITDAVLSCLQVDRAHPPVLALALTYQNADSEGIRPQSVSKKFIKDHSLPFLILFSRETGHVELDLMARKLKLNADSGRLGFQDVDLEIESNRKENQKDRNINQDGFLSGADKSSEELSAEEQQQKFLSFHSKIHYRHQSQNDNQSNNNRTYHMNYDKAKAEAFSQNGNNSDSLIKLYETQKKSRQTQGDAISAQTQRKKRSVSTNKIPSDSADYLYYPFNLPLTNPAKPIPRNKRPGQRQTILHSGKRPRTESTKRQRKDKRKSDRHRRKNRSRGFVYSHRWKTQPYKRAGPKSSHKQACSRRQLVVDFADIGWGDWIISPKSFQAYYCTGSCSFPPAKKLQSSNHATIQSIVHTIGLYSEVPPPCCVPDALTSLTLLYFDEHQNVVLKNYPGMSVQSCACR
ncbi:hypothetical protein ACOMHN_034543 [Nucella lapillus]